MASRTFANLGLRGGYSVGEDGWGDAATEDLRKLSILSQPVVFSFVTELPDSPTNGDRHVLTAEDSNSGAANSIIYWDVDTWVYISPLEGWEVWNIGDSTKYRFNGAAWVAAESAEAFTGMDPAFFFVGGTGDASRRVTYVPARAFSLPVSLTGSQAFAETPTTDDSNSASVAFDIQKNGASIGTITFDGGSQTGVFTFASGVSFAAGDRLSIVAPADLGALLGISITLMGTRIG